MNLCAVVVEGPSEESFVESVLAPLAQPRGVFLVPIIVRTKYTATKVYRGGGGKWSAYRDLAAELLSQPQWAAVGIMFDVYGRPAGTPPIGTPLKGAALQEAIKAAVEKDLEEVRGGRGRIIAGPVLFEFETLVLAALATGRTSAPRAATEGALRAIEVAGSVEAVNDGPSTSPSKRLLQWWPQYEKVIDGPALISEVPLRSVLQACPTFNEWLEHLLGAAGAGPS